MGEQRHGRANSAPLTFRSYGAQIWSNCTVPRMKESCHSFGRSFSIKQTSLGGQILQLWIVKFQFEQTDSCDFKSKTLSDADCNVKKFARLRSIEPTCGSIYQRRSNVDEPCSPGLSRLQYDRSPRIPTSAPRFS